MKTEEKEFGKNTLVKEVVSARRSTGDKK